MPDLFPDAMDRLELSAADLTEFGTARDALRALLGFTPSPLQAQVAQNKMEAQRQLAESQGLRVDKVRVREGRTMVERTTLRDARGRFVTRGARRVQQFLEEESSF